MKLNQNQRLINALREMLGVGVLYGKTPEREGIRMARWFLATRREGNRRRNSSGKLKEL